MAFGGSDGLLRGILRTTCKRVCAVIYRISNCEGRSTLRGDLKGLRVGD